MSVDATKLELGPANVYLHIKPTASLTTAMAGTNNDIFVQAQKPGAAGNSITLELIDPTTMNTPISIVVTGTAIAVTLAVDGASAITTTARQLVDALNAHPGAFSLIKAVVKAGDSGAGVVTALAATPLTGGSDTAVPTDIGALGDDLQVTFATEAGPLTAAQTGTIPHDKVVTGGSLQIQMPLKEIKLENLQRAIPNAIFFQNDTGALQKVEFRSRVGLSMRSRATKLEIRKIVGGVESTLTRDILVLNEVSPVDAEVVFPFSPTEQRILNATFEAWPDTNGVWGAFGDQII